MIQNREANDRACSPQPASQYVAVTGTSTHWIGVDNVDPTGTVVATVGSSTVSLEAPFAVATSEGDISVIPTDIDALQPLLDSIDAACGGAVAARLRLLKRQDVVLGLTPDAFTRVNDYVGSVTTGSTGADKVAWLKSILPGRVVVTSGTVQGVGQVLSVAAAAYVLARLVDWAIDNADAIEPPIVDIPTENYVAGDAQDATGTVTVISTSTTAMPLPGWVTKIEDNEFPVTDLELEIAVNSVYDGVFYTRFPFCSLVDDSYCTCSGGAFSGAYATADNADDPCSFTLLPASTVTTEAATTTSSPEPAGPTMGFYNGVVEDGDKSSSTVVALGGKDIDLQSTDVICPSKLYIPDEENGGQEVFYYDAGTDVPPDWNHDSWDYDDIWTNCAAKAEGGELSVTCDGMGDAEWSCSASSGDDAKTEVDNCSGDDGVSTYLLYTCTS